MPFLLAEILDFQGSAHLIGVGSLSYLIMVQDIPKLYTALAEFLAALEWQNIR